MSWLVLGLLAGAAGLAAAGAVMLLGQGSRAGEEAGDRRAMVGLGVLAGAVGLAAVGGAVLAGDGTGPEQIGAFAGAAAAVATPVLAIALVRRSGRSRRS